ncbi:MAG: TonB-dependent receptor [Ignavibacteriales bacterium]
MKSGIIALALASVSSLAIQAGVAHAQEVQEVVVTAQKREERLQDVPVAVSALTSQQIEASGVTNSRDLMQITPGLVVTQGSIVTQPQIRGVGARATGPGDEGSVPIYVDGVYQSAQTNALFEFNNIERIEVLKGPQGTLFGRNAQGGAINVITARPTQDFRFKASASYARFEERKGDLLISGGLMENLAGSLAIHASADGGFVKDIARHEEIGRADTTNLRGKLLWTPTDRAEVEVIGFYGQMNDGSYQSNHPLDGNTTGRLVGGVVNPTVIVASRRNEAALTFTPYFRTHTDGGSVTGKYDFGAFTVTALGSFQETEVHALFDLDVTPRDTSKVKWKAVDTAYTSEVRATSNGDGPFQWIAGVFYFQSDSGYRPQIINGSSMLANYEDANAYAVFAEGAYQFTDAWSVTAGLRYSDEKRKNVAYVGTVAGGLNYADPRRGEAEWDNLSPRLTVKYAFSPETHVYATYSKGFKSGLFNASTTSGPAPNTKTLIPVRPETLTSYEVGLKSKPRPYLRFNTAAYYYDYKDLQLATRASGISTLQNASDSTIYGAEAELAWAVTSRWNVNLGVALTHSEFTKWVDAIVYTPNPATGGIGNIVSTADVSGNALPKTPEWTVNLSTDYRLPTSMGPLTFAGSYYLSDSYFISPQNSIAVDSYQTLNASVRWDLPGDRWRMTLFGRNLTNDDHGIYISESATATHIGEARPWVVGLKVDFTLN